MFRLLPKPKNVVDGTSISDVGIASSSRASPRLQVFERVLRARLL